MVRGYLYISCLAYVAAGLRRRFGVKNRLECVYLSVGLTQEE
jgi:hypothetical protein